MCMLAISFDAVGWATEMAYRTISCLNYICMHKFAFGYISFHGCINGRLKPAKQKLKRAIALACWVNHQVMFCYLDMNYWPVATERRSSYSLYRTTYINISQTVGLLCHTSVLGSVVSGLPRIWNFPSISTSISTDFFVDIHGNINGYIHGYIHGYRPPHRLPIAMDISMDIPIDYL